MTEFKLYTIFGWRFHRVTMNTDDHITTYVPTHAARKDLDVVNFYTAGRVAVRVEGASEVKEYRNTGELSLDRPDLVAGTYISTAVEPVEFWCVSHGINKKRLPSLSAFRLGQGETCEIPKNSKLFVCSGKLTIGDKLFTGPETVAFSKNVTVKAGSDCLGLFFGGEK